MLLQEKGWKFMISETGFKPYPSLLPPPLIKCALVIISANRNLLVFVHKVHICAYAGYMYVATCTCISWKRADNT